MIVEPLSPILGARVSGIDLREDLSQVAERLRHAWRKHALLLFRDQELTSDQMLRVRAVFGKASLEGLALDEDGVNYVSNVRDKAVPAEGPLDFHLDNSFLSEPLRGLMLYAVETPPPQAGGDTLFSSAKVAYERLPLALKERISGLKVRHESKIDPRRPQYDHPLAFEHPDTGETVLFLSRRHVDKIVGLPPEEGRALADELASYIKSPERVFSHSWKTGDLIVWDNILLQHARTDFDPSYRRDLRRMMIA